MTKMLIAVALALCVVLLLIIPKTKKYRTHILIAFAGICAVLGAAQTFRNASLILPFYHPNNQTFYQPEFAAEGTYPDAILQLLVKGKTVYIKDDLDDYLAGHSKNAETTSYFDDWKYWMYQYYHQTNLTDFLTASGATVIAADEYNDSTISGEKADDFELLGYTNDLNRYLFPLSNLNEEWSNSFFYYWYYSSYLPLSEVYVMGDDINKTKELVILSDDKENETWYVMTKDYYDREVALYE